MEKLREATAYDHARMCDTLKCADCPLDRESNGRDVNCDKFIMEHYKEASEAIVKWCNEHPDMRWISVEERLPEAAKEVIVAYEDGTVGSDILLLSDDFCLEEMHGKATHWMPMPGAPGGVEMEENE